MGIIKTQLKDIGFDSLDRLLFGVSDLNSGKKEFARHSDGLSVEVDNFQVKNYMFCGSDVKQLLAKAKDVFDRRESSVDSYSFRVKRIPGDRIFCDLYMISNYS